MTWPPSGVCFRGTYVITAGIPSQMCDKFNKCEDSKEALAENNLHLPKLEGKDGCFQSGFNQV